MFVLSDAAVLAHPAVCTLHQEKNMRRPFSGCPVLLALVVGFSHTPLAMAGRNAGGIYAVSLRVVATVIALEPRGLVAIQTRAGATYEVRKGTTRRIGDTVACEHVARTCVPWETLDCRQSA